MEHVDAIVIGSGQGGVPFAASLAKEGKRVVLFERGRLGGSCTNYGCTPSKAFLAPAHTAARARRAEKLGVRGQITVDFKAAMQRVREVRDSFTAGVEARLKGAGVRVVHAEAAFAGERIVEGGGQSFEAPLVVINTGTSAFVPPIAGLQDAPYLTNVTFFDQRTRPRSMAVLGGGYVGLELGQGMARCGAEVHIIDSNARVLSREEPEASATLEESLRRDGVQLHLERRVTNVRHGGSVFNLTLDHGETLRTESLLVASGRRANTGALSAAASNVALDDKGFVTIDDRFATTCPGVYAIGDCAGQPAFTHVSWEDHRRLKAILAGEPRTRNDRVLSYSTFTEPQVARVGMTLDEATRKGIDARAVTMPITDIARAIEWGHEFGFYRLVVNRATSAILGATLVGYETAELVHAIQAHMEAGSTWHVLERSVHIHPTYGEGLPSLARLLLQE